MKQTTYVVICYLIYLCLGCAPDGTNSMITKQSKSQYSEYTLHRLELFVHPRWDIIQRQVRTNVKNFYYGREDIFEPKGKSYPTSVELDSVRSHFYMSNDSLAWLQQSVKPVFLSLASANQIIDNGMGNIKCILIGIWVNSSGNYLSDTIAFDDTFRGYLNNDLLDHSPALEELVMSMMPNELRESWSGSNISLNGDTIIMHVVDSNSAIRFDTR